MASIVDICNLALAHLGDRATISSIDPPEGSAQAQSCAQFYPIARDTLLELHPWRFALKRESLADLSDANPPANPWLYSYALPTDLIRVFAVTAADAQYDDETEPFEIEINGATPVIYGNLEDMVARFTVRVTDTTRFPPLFVTALSWLLASYLAGPILKGTEGMKVAANCESKAMAYVSQARLSDANQRKVADYRDETRHQPSWIAGR